MKDHMDCLTLIDTVYQHPCISFLVDLLHMHINIYVCIRARDSLKSWYFKWMGFILWDVAAHASVSSLTVSLCARCFNVICISGLIWK